MVEEYNLCGIAVYYSEEYKRWGYTELVNFPWKESHFEHYMDAESNNIDAPAIPDAIYREQFEGPWFFTGNVIIDTEKNIICLSHSRSEGELEDSRYEFLRKEIESMPVYNKTKYYCRFFDFGSHDDIRYTENGKVATDEDALNLAKEIFGKE